MSAYGKGLEQFRAPTNASHEGAIANNAKDTPSLSDTSQVVVQALDRLG